MLKLYNYKELKQTFGKRNKIKRIYIYTLTLSNY